MSLTRKFVLVDALLVPEETFLVVDGKHVIALGRPCLSSRDTLQLLQVDSMRPVTHKPAHSLACQCVTVFLTYRSASCFCGP